MKISSIAPLFVLPTLAAGQFFGEGPFQGWGPWGQQSDGGAPWCAPNCWWSGWWPNGGGRPGQGNGGGNGGGRPGQGNGGRPGNGGGRPGQGNGQGNGGGPGCFPQLPQGIRQERFRSIDGTDRPDDKGKAGDEQLRLVGDNLSYEDGNGDVIYDGPNPRTISNTVSRQGSLDGNSEGLSDILYQWGQFLDHDIAFTPHDAVFGTADIPVPADVTDPFFNAQCNVIPFTRSIFDTSELPRDQINEITSFIDASNVYGSSADTANSLRTFVDGLLATSQDGRMLPLASDGISYAAGDVRVNEQVGLIAFHALFVREHNRLAGLIKDAYCEATDEEIYQLARKLVAAEMQIITFREFLPALLGDSAPGESSQGFPINTDPRITNEFSTAAFRVGHTMLSPEFIFLNENGEEALSPLLLRDLFFNPGFFAGAAHHVDYVIAGQMQQESEEIDNEIIDDVRDFLFFTGGPLTCLDLASLNIQRGRDHGIPLYNALRVALGLAAKTDFADVTSNTDLQQKLAAVYPTVDDIDAWVGGLSEDHVGNAVVGELFRTIIVDQFIRLRDGDMHWFDRWPMNDIDHVKVRTFWRKEDVSLGKVIEDNTVHEGLAGCNVFYTGC